MTIHKTGVAILCAAFVGSSLLMVGCKKDDNRTPGQKVGDAIDKGIEKTGEAVEKTGEAIEGAGEKVKDASEKPAETPPPQ